MGSWWWWGATTLRWWAPLHEEHGSCPKAQKSLGLQRWGEESHVSMAAVQLASPRRGLWCGCAPLLLPGVNGVGFFCLFLLFFRGGS